jgi:hypothetical protein
MLTGEMIEAARAQGALLGQTAAAAILKQPKLAAKIDRVATGTVNEFSTLMRAAGLEEDDIDVLCKTLADAYRSACDGHETLEVT